MQLHSRQHKPLHKYLQLANLSFKVLSQFSAVWFKLWLNEKDQEVHESYINGFSEKVLFWVNGYLWAQK